MSTAVERFDDKARGAFDRIGDSQVYEGELLRHRVYTRFLHWMVAVFFFLALFSGFGIYLPWLFRWFTPIFGGGPLARAMHPWFGIGFSVFFGLQALNWLAPMTWTPADSRWMRNIKKIVSGEEKLEPPDTHFFNAGQKLQFWEIIIGTIVFLITGIVMWAGAPTFGRTGVWISYVLHDVSALIMLFGIFIHVYQSTIGQPGTFQSMTRGAVSERWAWTFHPAWFQQVTGRDAREAVEQARKTGSSEPKVPLI
ncbi:MAG TPA: formate dehydrogenase subunit gamma [Terriglobales bacterium]|nr:formate dehydrogenase subunit gamma [Terriglobales bacterium]